MKISVVGTGYVGLVAGTCFAEYGNEVQCVDIDERKVANLKEGILPIYEPGLEGMVKRNYKAKRLHFTTDLPAAIKASDIIFVAVGTPGLPDGRPDISGVLAVAEAIGRHSEDYKVVVNKSTVPVGMADMVIEAAGRFAKHDLDVVSNPEFLREGHALEDFMKPERVVIGSDSPRALELMKALYGPFVKESAAPILTMSIKSAELTKYACNSFLAMKVTFANVIANLCDSLGADYPDVKRGMQTDSRIGTRFLNAGIGYGGSCFPKDVRALVSLAENAGGRVPLLRAVDESNEAQKDVLFQKVLEHFRLADGGDEPLKGKKFALWGLAFKPATDDMREAPSLTVIRKLRESGATVVACDPEAEPNARAMLDGDLETGEMYSILEGKDALLILTEWAEFREPDFERMRHSLAEPLVFDGRNIYDRHLMAEFGFTYTGIGTGNER